MDDDREIAALTGEIERRMLQQKALLDMGERATAEPQSQRRVKRAKKDGSSGRGNVRGVRPLPDKGKKPEITAAIRNKTPEPSIEAAVERVAQQTTDIANVAVNGYDQIYQLLVEQEKQH